MKDVPRCGAPVGYLRSRRPCQNPATDGGRCHRHRRIPAPEPQPVRVACGSCKDGTIELPPDLAYLAQGPSTFCCNDCASKLGYCKET